MERTQFMDDETLRAHLEHRAKHPHEPTPTVVIILLTLFAAIVGTVFLAIGLVIAWPQMVARTWIGTLVLASAAVCVSAFAFWLREIKQLWLYAVLEIAAGIAIATQVATAAQPIVALIGFVGAIRIMVDGIARLRKHQLVADLIAQWPV